MNKKNSPFSAHAHVMESVGDMIVIPYINGFAVYDAYDDVLSKTAFDSYKSLTIAKMHSLISAIDDVYEKCDTNITTDNTAFKVNS